MLYNQYLINPNMFNTQQITRNISYYYQGNLTPLSSTPVPNIPSNVKDYKKYQQAVFFWKTYTAFNQERNNKNFHPKWFKVGNSYYYLVDSKGVTADGLAKIDNKLYYFKKGIAQKGFQIVDGRLFYFNPTSEYPYAVSGRQFINGETYYFNPTSYNAEIGDVQIDGQHYYFNEYTGVEMDGNGTIIPDSPETYKTIQSSITSPTMTKPGFYSNSRGKFYSLGGRKLKLVVGLAKIRGKIYYFNSQGFLYTPNTVVHLRNSKIFVNSDGSLFTGLKKIGSDIYIFSSKNGFALTGMVDYHNSIYFLNHNTKIAETGWHTISGQTYYFNPKTATAVTGWNNIDGKEYYFNQNGVRAENTITTVDDTTVGFNSDGSQIVGATGLQKIDNKYYYFGEYNSLKLGWQTIGEHKYYFNPSTGSAVTGFIIIDNKAYYFNENGEMEAGVFKTPDGLEYFTQKPKSGERLGQAVAYQGWLNLNENKYYFTQNSKAVTGVQKIDGYLYYFNNNGELQKSNPNNGLLEVDGKKYYVETSEDPTDHVYYLATNNWVNINGEAYYFGSDGAAATGIQKIGEYLYYFNNNGELKDIGELQKSNPNNGLLEVDGKKYYVETSKDSTNHRYYLATNDWATLNGKTYYFGSDGATVTGIQKIDGYLYYFNNNGELQKSNPNNGLLEVDGKKYYVETSKDSTYHDYYLETNDWATLNGKTYYFGSDGAVVTGIQKIGGYLYYFNNNGELQKSNPNNGLLEVDGKKYYVETSKDSTYHDYYLATNDWATLNGKTYYFGSDGAVVTGIQKIGGYLYYFNNNGELQKSNPNNGLLEVDGKKYYVETSKDSTYHDYYLATNDWATLNGKTYYFGSDGAAVTGIQKIGGYLYYFNNNGELQKSNPNNGLLEVDGKKYYIETSKDSTYHRYYLARNDWATINGKRYYFSPKTGAAVVGHQVIDGKYYYFHNDGTLEE